MFWVSSTTPYKSSYQQNSRFRILWIEEYFFKFNQITTMQAENANIANQAKILSVCILTKSLINRF